jgi:colanic acid/amylovoran biosynthesis glycosyltransferase
LVALISTLSLKDHVTLLGPLPTADVISWMHASHLFMLPSLAEGTPTVLLEAQASGMPVLATDVGGVRDIVQDGVVGSIVPAGDTAALTRELQRFIDHPDTWPRMGQEGRRFVTERHDIVKLNVRLVALFDRLIRGLPAQPSEHASGA